MKMQCKTAIKNLPEYILNDELGRPFPFVVESFEKSINNRLSAAEIRGSQTERQNIRLPELGGYL